MYQFTGLPDVVHEGWFEAQSTGLYSFKVESNDAAKLTVGQIQSAGSTGIHCMHTAMVGN